MSDVGYLQMRFAQGIQAVDASVQEFIRDFKQGISDSIDTSAPRGDYGHLPAKTQAIIGALGPLTIGMAYATPQFKEYVLIERAKARHKRRHPELY